MDLRGRGHSPPRDAGGQVSPIRVMLIDDHRTVLWGLSRLVDGENPRMQVVGAATSCAEAEEQLEAAAPDVILLDLDLGERSGIDGIPALRSRTRARILVLTGVRDPEAHHQAVLAGACGVVTKAEPADTILKAIEKANEGEIWLDRASTARLVLALSRNSADEANPVLKTIATLTSRERQIVAEMAADASASPKDVAAKLGISERTLRNHLGSIYDKLGLASRLELWDFAHRHGLAGPARRPA